MQDDRHTLQRSDGSPWRSSVLRCHPGDNDCQICRFLDGSRHPVAIQAVIELLDAKLAAKEEAVRVLTSVIASSEASVTTQRP